MRVAASVVLTEEQKRELERCARGRRTQARLVLRARIVLLAAEGRTDLEIAERLKVVPRTAARWRARFLKLGVAGLDRDAARPGRTPTMTQEAALGRSGIRMHRAPVGDKYVLEQMLSLGASLGGEQSGHIIFSGQSTTGDGLLTALLLLDILHRSGESLAELTADLKTFPQVIVNVKVREKRPLESIPSVAEAIRAAESELSGSGRVVIRYSGTEALARVMIEAESEPLMRLHADAIANAIRAELGI